MTSLSSDLIGIVDASLSRAFQVALLRCVLGTYRDTDEDCRTKYSWQIAHDLRGHLRRANLDTNLAMLAGRYPGVTASHEPNGKSNCYHTRLRAGRVVLTASAVPTPYSLPRDAEFRSTLARSPQMAFDFGPQQSPPAEDAPLYVLLLHGPGEEDQAMPCFVHLAVPDEDCSVILARINLFARFASLPELRPVTQVEDTNRDLGLRVRQRLQVEETGA